MSAPEAVPARRRVVVVRRRPVADAAPAPVVAPAPVNGADVSPAAPADGAEPLGDRLWRQVRHGGIDRDRLLPSLDKRRRALTKRMDKPLPNGWSTFVAGLAHTIATGKAPQRRNAEIALVEAVSRWSADVAELLPDRLADLRTIVDHGLSNPAPPPRKDGDG